MNSSSADNQETSALPSSTALQHTPGSQLSPSSSQLEQSIEQATDAVLEEIESVYQSRSHEIGFRDNERIEFSESVRVCPADLNAVPTGPSTMAEGRDLSLWGVSLVPPQPFAPDDCLLIEFTFMRAGNGRTVTMLAQVRHKRSADSAEETIGCQFLETYCSASVPAIA